MTTRVLVPLSLAVASFLVSWHPSTAFGAASSEMIVPVFVHECVLVKGGSDEYDRSFIRIYVAVRLAATAAVGRRETRRPFWRQPNVTRLQCCSV